MNIKKIADTIKAAINAARPPQSTLPAILLACSAISRPGLSAMELTASIISKQKKNGVRFGPMPDGSQNGYELMIKTLCEEFVSAFKFKSQVQAAVPIGGMQIIATGANAGGPVVVNGTNITAVNSFGVVK